MQSQSNGELSRLYQRPGTPSTQPVIGLQPLEIGRNRDGLLFVPSTYSADQTWPLVVMCHGAGSMAQRGIRPYLERAEAAGLILLALDSRGQTWDVILGSWGADVAFIDRALTHVFDRCRVDPERIAIEGFSDGASYALSLGLRNGDLFRAIVAFSPGFVVPTKEIGEPRVFITHGVDDPVLPVQHCSRRIVSKLQRDGYDVTYHEFDGGHEITSELIDTSLAWLGWSSSHRSEFKGAQ